MAEQPAAYPASFSVDYPERLSRWLIFVKWLFIIPQFILLGLVAGGGINFGGGDEARNFSLGAGTSITLAVGLIILFRAYFPRWLFDFEVALMRWAMRVWAYLFLLRDEYPPVEGNHPVRLEIQYPERLNRWLVLVKWLLAVPHYIVLLLLFVVLVVTTVIAWFAILFTGRYPPGLFDFAVGVFRWGVRVGAYVGLMTDRYPPFSLSA